MAGSRVYTYNNVCVRDCARRVYLRHYLQLNTYNTYSMRVMAVEIIVCNMYLNNSQFENTLVGSRITHTRARKPTMIYMLLLK